MVEGPALVIRVGRDEADMPLDGTAYTLLAKLVERPEAVAVRTITELADTLGVNALIFDSLGHVDRLRRLR